ncbi:unnamed protein product [Polarella glacialis]|uniref:Pentatricopeptide repeat-containing protein, chloroplastic n=1 Tax=Polarella glacialis TaxID=89957 RepID=A0A813GHX4_POLGL|nr:unnamed protein product [Polarella glacialis]
MLRACELAGRWPRALALLRQLRQLGFEPGVVTFSSAIGSLAGHSDLWGMALGLLHDMQILSVTPNSMTYSSCLGSLQGSAACWRWSLQLLRSLTGRALRPHASGLEAAALSAAAAGHWAEALALVAQLQGGRRPLLDSVSSEGLSYGGPCWAASSAVLRECEQQGHFCQETALLSNSIGAAD